ncbi:hypothetical protein GCM10007898_28740 [Dyella flagellata]|uniref:Uncharacterized protein n=2 Tax=Dyella flagellata TaxID=1867833 RepID=A0ABQ5XF78_9GAMM|nr:hypothetical protein GCM10007898_28740 [Dyella flagellata]
MHDVGAPPADLSAQSVVISDGAGKSMHGWFVPGIERRGAVLLLHGVRANRLSMLGRARFLHAAEHVDLCRYAGDAYKRKVLQFFAAHLHGA